MDEENPRSSSANPVLMTSSRAAKRGGFKRGGFPIWTCPSFLSFFVPFGTFPIFPGFSRFAPGMVRGFVLFLFLGLLRAPTRNSPERVRDTIWTFPERSVGNTRVWKPPGLASLNKLGVCCNTVSETSRGWGFEIVLSYAPLLVTPLPCFGSRRGSFGRGVFSKGPRKENLLGQTFPQQNFPC